MIKTTGVTSIFKQTAGILDVVITRQHNAAQFCLSVRCVTYWYCVTRGSAVTEKPTWCSMCQLKSWACPVSERLAKQTQRLVLCAVQLRYSAIRKATKKNFPLSSDF